MNRDYLPDVMQVCLNGHVITDLLHTHPERSAHHCQRCGAATLHNCPTCGRELPGAIPVPGLEPIGERRPPQRCPTCGAAFPWTEKRPALAPAAPLAVLENLLRRLPRTIRQLRSRHGVRPPFCIEDDYDLEDLLRALLPLHFEDVRPESRTPAYAAETRTDFLLAAEKIALTSKGVGPALGARELAEQLHEDVAYYGRQRSARHLLGFLYDPEQRLYEPSRFEAAWLLEEQELSVRCVVAW